jgi:hypothetical protein
MTRKTVKFSWVLITLLTISSASFSQVKSFDFLRSAPADAQKFLQAYMEPYTNAFGAGLNGGWYNTAKPHKLLGFDLTTSFNVGVVPSSAQSFDLSKIGLSSAVSATGITPTVAGAKTEGPLMQYKSGNTVLAEFHAPQGTGFKFVPVPTLQLGLGLPMGTEIKGRYVPKIKIGDNGDVSLWGIGLMHNITQYLPGDKLLPFDVSVFGGYTRLNANIGISLQPGSPQAYSPAVSFDNQKMNLTVTGLNLSAIGSLNLPVITFYGGLGYSKSSTEVQLDGNYPTPVLVTSPTPHSEYNNSGVVPGAQFPQIKIDNYSGLRANVGFRIKLAVITIHADYTRAQYNVLSAGLGISVR